MLDNLIQAVTVYALPVIFAITYSELARGYAAARLGDSTPREAGRLDFNPMSHLDPIGTVLAPLAVLVFSLALQGPPMLIGWARRIPIDYGNMRDPKRGLMWVALAGPAANLVMAFVWGAMLKVLLLSGGSEMFFYRVGAAGIAINVSFAVINLLPVPPLAGSRVILSLLPANLAWRYAQLDSYGFIILILLMQFGLLGAFVRPVYTALLALIRVTFALP